MPSFKNMKDLERYVNQMAKKAMNEGNGVKNVVIDEGKKQVQETVYDAYAPHVYERTGELKENWKSEPSAEGIAIFNDRRDGEKNVALVIETGQGYEYDFPYSDKPRPFTENTRKTLDGSSQLKDGLRKDLRNVGLDVE
ncbi:hypothetical protein EVU96_09360 [Bacillus infantis]|uniref:hypothetical protein n=1 Tax=Bacillus infantis TaxID=324767 RepID=UPI00101E03FD|nr:hypothetical protein [Bacillus infantis]RYI30613.1 hypothetical protein EVU96_09360 [Bacillus infantis]